MANEPNTQTANEWPLWEVFIRAKHGEIALRHARDTYTRRMEGVSIWVIRSSDVVASDPGSAGPTFEPAESKVYRHPTFYVVPDYIKHI